MTGMPKKTLDTQSLDIIFNKARTHNYWQEKDVDDSLLKDVYDLTKMGATSANCCPLRIVFVKSKPAKEKLKPALMEGNVEKTMLAPVTALFGYDMAFYEKLDFLFPHEDARSWFEGNDQVIYETAFRNSSLQAAYFMLAARSLGLDCGPMSGFDNAYVDEHFFKDTKIKSNFICNLGYGVPEKLYPRLPKFDFHQVSRIL